MSYHSEPRCRNCVHWGQEYYGGPFGTCCNGYLDAKPEGFEWCGGHEVTAWKWPETFECDSCELFQLRGGQKVPPPASWTRRLAELLRLHKKGVAP